MEATQHKEKFDTRDGDEVVITINSQKVVHYISTDNYGSFAIYVKGYLKDLMKE